LSNIEGKKNYKTKYSLPNPTHTLSLPSHRFIDKGSNDNVGWMMKKVGGRMLVGFFYYSSFLLNLFCFIAPNHQC